MSLLGAMDTAITGLTSQSAAFANIGDNVANSQTIGFKGTETRFNDYLTLSNKTENLSGSVVATPSYTNTLQGSLSQSSSPLAMAITGNGFFPVSVSAGTTSGGQPVLSTEQYYTRAGDFTTDQNGYIVNGAGQFLNAWPVDASGNVDKTQLQPVKVSEGSSNPVATTKATLSANLPATPSSTKPLTMQVPVYDALGKQHVLSLAWSQTTTPGQWTVAISSTGATPNNLGAATVNFGTGGAGAPAGLINSITDPTGATIGYAAGQPAQFNITANFGSGTQPIALNLGTFGQTDGLTQFSGTDLDVHNFGQNGVTGGQFTGLTTSASGNITATYSNGQSKVIAQVPVVTFSNPDGLQRENSQAFSATLDSGTAVSHDAGAGGAGSLVTGSVEGSNVDIATQFSELIVAQRAYAANTKIVTTADDMLQQTVDMKR